MGKLGGGLPPKHSTASQTPYQSASLSMIQLGTAALGLPHESQTAGTPASSDSVSLKLDTRRDMALRLCSQLLLGL